jgi:cytochrome b561
MPWVLGLVIANFAGGLASAWLWRDPEDLAASGHYTVGIVVVGLFVLAATVGRRIDRAPRLRVLHPWIGAAALLASGIQIFLGLQIVPVR